MYYGVFLLPNLLVACQKKHNTHPPKKCCWQWDGIVPIPSNEKENTIAANTLTIPYTLTLADLRHGVEAPPLPRQNRKNCRRPLEGEKMWTMQWWWAWGRQTTGLCDGPCRRKRALALPATASFKDPRTPWWRRSSLQLLLYALSPFPNLEMQHNNMEYCNLDEKSTTSCVLVEWRKGFARSTKNGFLWDLEKSLH